MPKQRSKAAAPDSGSQLKSDEEIIKDRRRLDAFDSADSYLGSLGLGLWGLAAVWFIYFSDFAKAVPSLHQGASDVCLVLVACGTFCRGIARASPRLWSTWRFAFHIGWCPVFVLIAALAGFYATSSKRAISSSVCWCFCGACAILAYGAVATFPGSSLGSGKAANSPMARLLFLCEGLAGIAIAGSSVLGLDWRESLGPLASALTALPLFMCAAGLCFCSTESELLVAAPCSTLFCILASLRSCYFSGLMAAIPTAALASAHACLYLPLPFKDPESNIFHMSLRRWARSFVKMMSSPASGFGDDGEGG